MMKKYIDHMEYCQGDENSVLKNAIDGGIINIDEVRQAIEMNERRRILNAHQYSIYESKGRWCSYLPDKSRARLEEKV